MPLEVNEPNRSPTGIHALPTEVLLCIFRAMQVEGGTDVHSSDDNTIGIRNWFAVLGVCRTWRMVVCGAPLLWTKIDIGTRMPVELLRFILARSAALPLTVSFNHTRRIGVLLAELAGRVSRIQALRLSKLDAEDPSAVSDFLTENAFPELASFEVSYRDPKLPQSTEETPSPTVPSFTDLGRIALYLWFPEARFPRLGYLKLQGVALDITADPQPPLASTLKTLLLDDCICADIPLLRFLDLLQQSCPRLEHLRLKRYRFGDPHIGKWVEDGSHALPVVSLPATFRLLELEDVGLHTARLLSSLSLPLTSSLHLTKLLEYYPGSDDVFDNLDGLPLGDCLPSSRATIPQLGALTKLDVQLGDAFKGAHDPANCVYAFHASHEPGDSHTFSLIAYVSDCPSIADSVVSVFGRSPLAELTLVDVMRHDFVQTIGRTCSSTSRTSSGSPSSPPGTGTRSRRCTASTPYSAPSRRPFVQAERCLVQV
ncbi:hypothetical protein C8Q77DRAFT_1136070 [Trametes polyzona]|nr:hypothetical protein C8Q77DRAFT_1136070 [Trametes polyzona]